MLSCPIYYYPNIWNSFINWNLIFVILKPVAPLPRLFPVFPLLSATSLPELCSPPLVSRSFTDGSSTHVRLLSSLRLSSASHTLENSSSLFFHFKSIFINFSYYLNNPFYQASYNRNIFT